jgi:hypothetical protein
VTGQTAEGTQDSSTWREPVELLVVLGPGSRTPTGPAAPPPPASPGPAHAPQPPPTRPLTALDALRQLVPVTQDCPPRLALVALPASAAPGLEALPYVFGVYDAAPPADVLATLGDIEMIFVGAWLARLDTAAHQGDEHRRGQGLPWDAPGYEPPDAAAPA